MSATESAPYREALDLIIEEHREIQELFREFDDLEEFAEKRALVRRVCSAISIHTEMEEELFYPALRELLSETSMIDEAEVEHELAKNLVAELQDMDVHDALFDQRFAVLVESVNHHLAQEETEMFDQVRADRPDLEALAQEMRERKEELQAEFEPDEEELDEREMDDFDDEE